jgi:hypothetical protein
VLHIHSWFAKEFRNPRALLLAIILSAVQILAFHGVTQLHARRKYSREIRRGFRLIELKLAEGYRDNIVGFGWTNDVFLELLHTLPEEYLNLLIAQPAPTSQP